MKTLFILGNGFDINLGLETRYTDFYPFYKGKKSERESISKLKNSINTNIDTWADLELAFGEYTKKINSIEEFDEIFIDIQTSLSEYLQHQEKTFNVNKINTKKILDHLSYPENLLANNRSRNEIKTFKGKWKSNQWDVGVITLNYTKTFEKIFQNKIKNIELGTHHNTNKILLRDVLHIHGYTDKRMILGVNDETQIGNISFQQEIDIIETLIKEKCNQAQGHMLEEACKVKVQEANLICIFGSSLGKTDKIWWDLIIKKLEGDCRLIIFDRGSEISPLRPQEQKRIEREKIKLFLGGRDIKSDKIKEIENKIYIGTNTEMFNLKLN